MENDELKEMICEKLKMNEEEYWDFVKGICFNALTSPDIIQELEYYTVVKRSDILSEDAVNLLKHYSELDRKEEEPEYAY